MSFKPEVIADASGKWCENGLRFATEREALDNARNFADRWMLAGDYRAAPSNDPVNYQWTTGGLVAIDADQQEEESVQMTLYGGPQRRGLTPAVEELRRYLSTLQGEYALGRI